MSVASDHVATFRDQWSDRFIDTVTITDLTSRGVFNRTTKQFVTEVTSTIYTGSALIRAASDSISNRGETGEVLYTHKVMLPDTANGIQPNHQITVNTCTYDTDLVGAVLTVQSVHQDSYNTRRELRCLLSQGGGDRG